LSRHQIRRQSFSDGKIIWCGGPRACRAGGVGLRFAVISGDYCVFSFARVGKSRGTVSDLGVGSYAQGSVAEAGVAVGCVSTSRRYSHATEKASQSGQDRPRTKS